MADQAPVATLIGSPDIAVWLRSRAGLPSFITVEIGAPNPFFGGCPTVTVEARSGTRTGAVLDSKRFRLTDPLWRLDYPYDCRGETTLFLGGHRGPVVVTVKPDGGDLRASAPIVYNDLPDGSALDEQDGVIDEIGDVIGGASKGTVSLVKWIAVGAIALAAASFAPAVVSAVRELTEEDDE